MVLPPAFGAKGSRLRMANHSFLLLSIEIILSKDDFFFFFNSYFPIMMIQVYFEWIMNFVEVYKNIEAPICNGAKFPLRDSKKDFHIEYL